MSDSWDFSELRTLAFDMGKGTAETVAGARKIIQVAAFKIKAGMVADAAKVADAYAKRFPYSITYDTKITPFGAEAEIGPDKSLPGRQGALGNILYFGTSTQGPTIPDIAGPLNKEATVVEGLLAELAVKNTL